MFFYSFLLVAASVWNLMHPNGNVELLTVISSIAVLVCSVFISSQRFGERSILMKNCYVKLDEICSKAKRAEKNKDESEQEKVESEYTNTLMSIENQNDYDYLSLRYVLRNNDDTTLPKFYFSDWGEFFFQKFIRILFVLFFLLLPLGLYFLWILWV